MCYFFPVGACTVFCVLSPKEVCVYSLSGKHYSLAGVSRGKGQDLFLRAFYQSLRLIEEKKLQMPFIHAAIVGSDINAQTKFETELRQFVAEKNLQGRVHFVNKTLNVSPYLASIDVLVQNSQVILLICLLHLVFSLLHPTSFSLPCITSYSFYHITISHFYVAHVFLNVEPGRMLWENNY